MDDQTLKILCSNFNHAITLSPLNSGQLELSSDLVDTSGVSDDTHEIRSNKGQTLPIFQKIENLSNKVQVIRKEHARLCNEVKGMTVDSLLGSEAFIALQNLKAEYELLKNKYHRECELLKKKYLDECSERKKLYNEVVELKGNIRVFCRCRPLKQDEIAKGSTSVVDFDTSQENELHIIGSDSSRKQFKLDHVFRPEDNQEAVFVQTLPIVTSVLDGYNVCIFAYGQTGTGKTHTMEGTPEDRGVNYRTLEELFRISNERSSIIKYELFVSMLEVYNEKIRDLLVDSSNQPVKKLDIKQSAEGTQEVPGLVEVRVYGTDEVWGLLKSGSQARSVGSTNANELSSRSHCLLRVTVVAENLINGRRTRSHLWLVDLAGSERVGKIEVEGNRLRESQFINKSLSALADVISALASKSAHTPYRNSKLTHMLQSSLGGDCKTLMFVQISPNAADYGETICSLTFASRVRGVEHGPARRQTDLAELFKYKQLAEKARQDEKETKKLQDNVQSLQLRLGARENICKNLQDKVRDLENQLVEERKKRMKQETRVLEKLSVSTQSTLSASSQAQTDKKPPLVPSKLRLPLRRISNLMSVLSPVPLKKKNMFLPVVNENKENNTSRAPQLKENKSRPFLKPRRVSIATIPSPAMTNQAVPPKRRASIATLQPESNMNMINKSRPFLKPRRVSIATRPSPAMTNQAVPPKRRVSIATHQPESNRNMFTTPIQRSSVRSNTDRIVGRQSYVWDPHRVWRTSRVSSPLPQSRNVSAATIEATPVGRASSSSNFRGSPPSQMSVAGSWKPKHPTVVALQEKQSYVWDPQRVWRTSRVSSPLLRSRNVSAATIEATPVGRASISSNFRGSPPPSQRSSSSSKFRRGSPPSQMAVAGSWKPKHPTVVALQKKHLVWSPLKLKCRRSSLMS